MCGTRIYALARTNRKFSKKTGCFLRGHEEREEKQIVCNPRVQCAHCTCIFMRDSIGLTQTILAVLSNWNKGRCWRIIRAIPTLPCTALWDLLCYSYSNVLCIHIGAEYLFYSCRIHLECQTNRFETAWIKLFSRLRSRNWSFNLIDEEGFSFDFTIGCPLFTDVFIYDGTPPGSLKIIKKIRFLMKLGYRHAV